jgi:uncharacterized membrane protein YcaP (DUF421 family)
VDSILRAAVMYAFLLVVFRLAGKRTLAEATPFDLVLLLVISEATQQALVGTDFSMTSAWLVILTLVAIDVALGRWRQTSRRVEKLLDDVPLVLVDRGRPLRNRMDQARVDEQDIMESARQEQGLESMSQIKYAVLETDGSISIIPWRHGPAAAEATSAGAEPAGAGPEDRGRSGGP